MTKDMKEKKGERKEKKEEEMSHVKGQYKYRMERRWKRKNGDKWKRYK